MKDSLVNYRRNRPDKSSKDFTQFKKEQAEEKERKRDFFAFFKPFPWLIASGFILGVLLAAGAEFVSKSFGFYIIPRPALTFLLLIFKEIGLGLIVSTIAVFGYETILKIRGEFDRQQREESILDSMDAAVKVLKTADDFAAIHSEDIEKAGKRLLDLIFHDDTLAEQEFKKVIESLIRKAETLKNTKTIYSQSYLSFITWLCANIVETNTTALSKLEKSASQVLARAPWDFSLPTPESVAGQMLRSQLSCLTKNDLYQTISNVLFWESEDFDDFWNETEIACSKEVKIQRLFNLSNLIDDKVLLDTKFDSAKKIIDAHKKLEESTKKQYEVRFLTKIRADEAINSHGGQRTRISKINLYSFGIFTHKTDTGEDTDVVSFEVEDERFSQISISRNKSDVREHLSRFKKMWEISEGVENPFEKDIVHFNKIVR